MSKSNSESASEFLKPSLFDALKQDLVLLEAIEPGSRSARETIKDLLPLIKGCRDRGHSWQRITGLFQKYLPGLTVGTLRKVAYELDPALKGTVKGINLAQPSESIVPVLDQEDEESEETDWESDQEVEAEEYEDEDDEGEDMNEEEETEAEVVVTTGRRSKT